MNYEGFYVNVFVVKVTKVIAKVTIHVRGLGAVLLTWYLSHKNQGMLVLTRLDATLLTTKVIRNLILLAISFLFGERP
jgi:hypothetical protein